MSPEFIFQRRGSRQDPLERGEGPDPRKGCGFLLTVLLICFVALPFAVALCVVVVKLALSAWGVIEREIFSDPNNREIAAILLFCLVVGIVAGVAVRLSRKL